MFLSLLKTIAFALVVLLVGQISIAGDTVGGHLVSRVKKAWTWGGHEIGKSRMLASLGSVPFVSQASLPWKSDNASSEASPPSSGTPRETTAEEETKDTAEDETFTASDRESILRLLQR